MIILMCTFLFCEPRRGDFYFAFLMCCLFCINDLFYVRLFVLFCEPKCEVFWFCVFGGLGVLTCFGQMINLMYLVLGFDICLDSFFF